MYRWLAGVLLAMTLFAANSFAQEAQFQTTTNEIIDVLSRPVVKTRAYVPASMTRTISVVEKKENRIEKKTVVVQKNDPTPRANLKIEFDYNAFAVRRPSFSLLDALGRAITSPELSDKTIRIKGHTDSDGSDAYNLTLSLNRAMSVKNYLTGNFRIDPERLKIIGYGEAMPLVSNSSAANRQLNRRVEIQIAGP